MLMVRPPVRSSRQVRKRRNCSGHISRRARTAARYCAYKRLSVTENDPGRTGRAFDLILRSVAEPFRQMFQNRDVFAACGTSAFFPLGGSGAFAPRATEPGD